MLRPHLLCSLLITAALASQAPAKQTAPTAPWFSQIEQTVAAKPGDEKIVCSFPFENPNDVAQEWRDVNASCTCTNLSIKVGDRTYSLRPKPKEMVEVVVVDGQEQRRPVTAIPIAAHERGSIDVHVDLHGFGATKVVSVDIHSTDPAAPETKLRLNAVGLRAVVLDPDGEIDLGVVAPGVAREFTVKVTSLQKPQFAILGNDPPPMGLSVTSERTGESAGGSVWTIKGTFQSKDQKANGGQIRFATDIPGGKYFAVTVKAKVAQPVEVTPGFLTLGTIKHGTGAKATFRIQSNDGTDLTVKAIRFEKLSFAAEWITATPTKDGKNVVVEIAIAAAAAKGLLRGDIVVELEHPTCGQQRVLFNGFVR